MFTKFASFNVTSSVLVPTDATASQGLAMVKQSHRVTFDYEVRPGFLYVRSRAISSRCNDNFDEFPAEEIKKGYKTFIGKPVFVNHHNDNHRRARGVIIDAVLHEDTNPDGSPDTWAEVLMEVDAINFPKLADAIQKGHIDRTSMGTDVAYSICSACGNKATSPAEYCVHIPRQKGSRIYKADPKTGVKEGILIREICYGLSFFENSLLVEEPADPTAFFLGVDDRGVNKTASKTAADNPLFIAPKFEDFGSEDSYDDEKDYEDQPRKNKGQGNEYRPSWQTQRRVRWRNRLRAAISEHGVSWIPFMNAMKETTPGINNHRLLGHYHRMLREDPDNFHAFVQSIANKPNNERTSSKFSQKTAAMSDEEVQRGLNLPKNRGEYLGEELWEGMAKAFGFEDSEHMHLQQQNQSGLDLHDRYGPERPNSHYGQDEAGDHYYEIHHPSGWSIRDYNGPFLELHHASDTSAAQDAINLTDRKGNIQRLNNHPELHTELKNWVNEYGKDYEDHISGIDKWRKNNQRQASLLEHFGLQEPNKELMSFFANMRKGAPFAGYEDFDACVLANSDKDDPEAYCATIMRKVEGPKKEGQLLQHFVSTKKPESTLNSVANFNIDPREDGNIIITAKENGQILATALANISVEDKQVRMTSLEVLESSRGRGFGSNMVRIAASLPEYLTLEDSGSYTMRIIGSTEEATTFYDKLGAKVLQHYANTDVAPFVIWSKAARLDLAKDATLQFESYLDMADDLDSLMGNNKSMNDKPTDTHSEISENDLFLKRGPIASLRREAFFEVFAYKLGEHPLDIENGITKNGVQNLKDMYHASNDDEKSDGRRWYSDGQHLARALGNGDVEKGAGVLAAYSPQTEWDQNILNAAHHLATGSPPEKGWGVNPDSKGKSTQIIQGHNFDDTLGHSKTGKRKTWHFAHLLKNGGDDGCGTRHVAVDSWALRALANNHEMKGGEKLLARQRNYDHYADMYRTAADQLNSENANNPDWEYLHPHQLQAITWLHIKNRAAQHGEESNKKGRKGRNTRSENVNKKKKEVLKELGIDESTTNEGNIHLSKFIQHFASPMSTAKDAGETERHKDTPSSYCKTCGVKIFKVNDGSPYPWQHDLDAAGLTHQAEPLEEDKDK